MIFDIFKHRIYCLQHFCALGIPCAVNEGDCDSDEECEIELFCGSNNCPDSIELDLEVDCCFALTSNTIISPNYPKPYPSNVIETWQLNADIGFMINLQFISFQVGIKSMLLNIISLRRLMFPLFYFIIHRIIFESHYNSLVSGARMSTGLDTNGSLVFSILL